MDGDEREYSVLVWTSTWLMARELSLGTEGPLFYTVFISYVNYGLNIFMKLSYKLILVTHLHHPFSWILSSVWQKDLPLVITVWFFKLCLGSQCFMASTYDRFCDSPGTTKCKIARSASSCTDRDVSWVFITAIILGTTAAIVSREVLLGMKNEVFI